MILNDEWLLFSYLTPGPSPLRVRGVIFHFPLHTMGRDQGWGNYLLVYFTSVVINAFSSGDARIFTPTC